MNTWCHEMFRRLTENNFIWICFVLVSQEDVYSVWEKASSPSTVQFSVVESPGSLLLETGTGENTEVYLNLLGQVKTWADAAHYYYKAVRANVLWKQFVLGVEDWHGSTLNLAVLKLRKNWLMTSALASRRTCTHGSSLACWACRQDLRGSCYTANRFPTQTLLVRTRWRIYAVGWRICHAREASGTVTVAYSYNDMQIP